MECTRAGDARRQGLAHVRRGGGVVWRPVPSAHRRRLRTATASELQAAFVRLYVLVPSYVPCAEGAVIDGMQAVQRRRTGQIAHKRGKRGYQMRHLLHAICA